MPYALQDVLYWSVQTGSDWAAGFTGQVDGYTIELYDGSIAQINFEPASAGAAINPSAIAYTSSSTTIQVTANPSCGKVVTMDFVVVNLANQKPAFPMSAGFSGTFTLSTAGITGIGVYEVCVRGYDASGNLIVYDCSNLLAVYDPSAGFVTGGGWIDSPAGALAIDPDVTGKANFGFVSKYQKNATVPDGSTEFVFTAGSLNFHSASYQWLVVNQSAQNAQFKGIGTINGGGDYGFMIWATDNAKTKTADTFRIQIWDNDNAGAIVYDNGVATPLGGGNIIVQTK
jgi:hypothetical protein